MTNQEKEDLESEMTDREQRCLEFYELCASGVRSKLLNIAAMFDLPCPRIFTESESTSELFNNYELLRVHMEWRDIENKCGLDRIISMSQAMESRDPDVFITYEVNAMRQQIQSYLSKKQ